MVYPKNARKRVARTSDGLDATRKERDEMNTESEMDGRIPG
jgi:hypothetical protein